jgi:heptosyltransferase II
MASTKEDNKLFRFLNFTSRLTEWFPKKGAKIIDNGFAVFIGNGLLYKIFFWRNLKKLKKIRSFNKICVLADLNIGDALFAESMVAALRIFFPKNQIDCIANHKAAKLLGGDHKISTLYPIYSGSVPPTEKDLSDLKEILVREKYDLIINMSFFFSPKQKNFPEDYRVFNLNGQIASIVHEGKNKKSIIHVVYQNYKFIFDLFSKILTPQAPDDFSGVNVTLSDEAIFGAKIFLQVNDIDSERPKVFLNPDTSSRFTRIPTKIQAALLDKLTELPVDVLLGSGHTIIGLEKEILNVLPAEKRNKIIIVPADLSIDAYAALIDFCDIFVTGDTGPMHLAATRKFSKDGNFKFRNRTAVLSISGSGSSRIHGYDSEAPGHYPANQDALARGYDAPNFCRNLTCCAYSEKGKTCRKILCFDNLDLDKIISDIELILKNKKPSE